MACCLGRTCTRSRASRVGGNAGKALVPTQEALIRRVQAPIQERVIHIKPLGCAAPAVAHRRHLADDCLRSQDAAYPRSSRASRLEHLALGVEAARERFIALGELQPGLSHLDPSASGHSWARPFSPERRVQATALRHRARSSSSRLWYGAGETRGPVRRRAHGRFPPA